MKDRRFRKKNPVVQILQLEVEDYIDDHHWRWALKSADGEIIADHDVRLSPSDLQCTALNDLPAYVERYLSPDRRVADERRAIDDIGRWLTQEVLGEDIGKAIVSSAAPPIAVRVILPPMADSLLLIPLDISQVNGRPLALSGVRFVFEMREDSPPPAKPIGSRLRFLALFSVPPAQSPLNLRRERQELKSLVRRLTGALGLAVELRVLQYGVTRQNLEDALEEGEGWDVIHFSGHGRPGTLVLETPEGHPDLIPSDQIVELLRLTGQSLKLVTLSACLSAAGVIEQALFRMGERDTVGIAEPGAGQPAGDENRAPAVARALCRDLDCAVLAMRYSVEDEFAIALTAAVYERLFLKQQSLPQALQLALAKVLGQGGAQGKVPGSLSLATPALFGRKAAELTLIPPEGSGGRPNLALARFPDEAEHFVGRVQAMTKASATLAIGSARSGVLFHGMAGAGKTSCALELVYHHAAAKRFQAFVWYEAPKDDRDISLALHNFALAMERQIPDFAMVHVVDHPEAFEVWLPQLTELLENYAVLVVLDNLESLLTSSGDWRDGRWQKLMAALLKPRGLSRVVMTSRVRPGGLAATEIIPVHALPLHEALLLVRELCHLPRLLDGSKAERELVRRTLRLVQGHPKLIHLAEALAARPDRLREQLDRAEAVHGDRELDAFFRDGETSFDPEQFTRALQQWSRDIAATLPPGARTCFHFLCAIEEEDRDSFVISVNWRDVWKRLGRPDPVPDAKEALELLVDTGLVDKREIDPVKDVFSISIHPAVADAGRAEAGPEFQRAVDWELAATWTTLLKTTHEQEDENWGFAPLISRAGLAAFPYLTRLRYWESAASMLAEAIHNNYSPAMIAAALPRARILVEAMANTEGELRSLTLLANLLRRSGRKDEAKSLFEDVLSKTVQNEDFAAASKVSGDLINLLAADGKLEEAVKLADEMASYTRRAGLGPWTELADEGWRLQLLNQLGRNKEVLDRVEELVEEMKKLSKPGSDEMVSDWNVRESVLDCGRSAALALGEWSKALEFNDDIIRSQQRRRAPILEQASSHFNNYGPLLRLKMFPEAEELLMQCKAIFEQEDDITGQGMVMSALGDLESNLDRLDKAQQFERSALRLKYVVGNSRSIGVSHFNLANYIIRARGSGREALAHRLASLALASLTSHGFTSIREKQLRLDLQFLGESELPRDFSDWRELVEETDGVRFAELVERLTGGRVGGDELLQAMLQVVRSEPDPD